MFLFYVLIPLVQPKSLAKTNCCVTLHKTLPIVDISGFGVISATVHHIVTHMSVLFRF